jgi:hypothetical protein
MHPAARHHLPFFAPGADGSDLPMVVMGIFDATGLVHAPLLRIQQALLLPIKPLVLSGHQGKTE